MSSRYFDVYDAWKTDPAAFWLKAAEEIDWFTAPRTAFDETLGAYGRWFPDAVVNTCYNCVDRHAERGRSDQAAIIYDSAVTNSKRIISFAELKQEVSALGAVLQEQGVAPGDRVVIYMPMVPEAVVAMLACARIGAIHSVVFGGFAASELAKRINDCQPKIIISASCGIEPNRIIAYKPLLDEAVAMADHKPSCCLILQRAQQMASLIAGRDLDYDEAVTAAKAQNKTSECVPLKATDPLYILYTSGTTGQPKGVVRDNGGHMVAMNWSMSAIYDMAPGDVFWAASDVGWVVGHSYIVYAPLLRGCTTLLFEGKPVGTPDAGTFWRVIEDHKVAALFTAPTAFRAIKKEDPKGLHLNRYDISSLRTLFLAGERADPDTIQWAQDRLGVPVIDHWWQTETGWAIAGNPVGLGSLPVKKGSPSVPMPGYDVRVLDDEGRPVECGILGNIVVKLPLPPSCLPTLWLAEERFRQAYLDDFPGFYKTADAGFVDEDGYLFIMSRTDDIINVAGHRLSTGGMEEAVANHPDVAECAVVGVKDALKGQLPMGFLILNSGVDRPHRDIEAEVVKLVRDTIGPVAAFKNVVTVSRLPKTRSGKILRAIMQKLAEGEAFTIPATIDDPAILDEIAAVLAES